MATINPDYPIWDRFVLEFLGLKPLTGNRDKKIKDAVETMAKIRGWYQDYIVTDEARRNIDIFASPIVPYRRSLQQDAGRFCDYEVKTTMIYDDSSSEMLEIEREMKAWKAEKKQEAIARNNSKWKVI